MPVGGRMGGKGVGVYSSNANGRGYSGINEEIMYVSIGMAITIAILISLALCYIAREKCRKKREFFVTA
ncbi:uncharacterized protein LOC135940614 [Cloeon dipterum]|uniref:Uncharacterized protein n=1 Tax=Cloeon dipterum TaxID=197152 RepID=A0A8S1BZH6_9INSE|nr:Hypothetical predicted protein [Cloeon dipterum]